MQSLLETQRRFGAALLDWSSGASWGMAVYRNNVLANLTGALANVYPIVRKIVGAEFFDAMARQYATLNPSTSGDLNDYGARMPAFVAAFKGTQDLPYLSDVARMEWLAHLSYSAADSPSARAGGVPDFRPANIDSLRLRCAPGSALLQSDWPLARLWEIHQDDFRGEIEVAFVPGPYRMFIHRPEWRVQVFPVTLGEFRLLAGAGRGEPLGEVLEAAAAVEPAFDPAPVLARWVGLRALAI
jgi:hypothetical protein